MHGSRLGLTTKRMACWVMGVDESAIGCGRLVGGEEVKKDPLHLGQWQSRNSR